MYPYIQIILPSYAVMTFIGTFCVLIFLYLRSYKCKIEFEHFLKLFMIAIVGVFIGSKLLFIMIQLPNLFIDFSINNVVNTVMNSGYVYFGGLLGMLAGIYVYISRLNIYSLELIYDMVAPGIPLFHMFGRIGCFMAGCCYGKEINHIIIGDYIRFDRIPTQLIEAAFEFILFVLLYILDKKAKKNLIMVYMIIYSLFRFSIEFLRGDLERGIFLGLSTSQWIAIIILCYYLYKVKKINKLRRG